MMKLSRHWDPVRQRRAEHTQGQQECRSTTLNVLSDAKAGFYLSFPLFYRLRMTRRVKSAGGSLPQSERMYSHDSALSEGEVLHQDVKASVLIVEELPHPPGQSESTQRLLQPNAVSGVSEKAECKRAGLGFTHGHWHKQWISSNE